MSKKANVIHVEFFIENGAWAAKGVKGAPRLRVEGPTLQATRRRVRREAIALLGPNVQIESTLRIPASLEQQIAANKKRRAELREARTELRADTMRILDRLRDDMGASYDDAGELLGLDASVLMRAAHSTMRINEELDTD